jgi:hypothetical protein
MNKSNNKIEANLASARILKNERRIKNAKRDLRELNLSNNEIKSYKQIIANAKMAITADQIVLDNCDE